MKKHKKITAYILTSTIIFAGLNAYADDANEIIEGLGTASQPLAVKDMGISNFSINESEDNLADRIATQTNEKNVTLSNLSYKRVGSEKTYAATQVKNVTINNSFSIKDLDLKDSNNRFTAILKPVSGTYLIEVSGEYMISQKVPLLTRNITKGDKISQDDIELKNFPKDKIENNITDINNIIGKSATKMMAKGQMVSAEDIRNPIVITKNSTVSAIYRSTGLEIKAMAVAQDDGGEGDVIRLKNFDSGKIFRAVVQADGTVFIGTNNTKNLSATITPPVVKTGESAKDAAPDTVANISIDKNFN